MIELERKKEKKWIFQKNVSSKDIIQTYVETINDLKSVNAKESIQRQLIRNNGYKGRSENGSLNTLGVRFSQMCFYMFGYKSINNIFVPTKMTENLLESDDDVNSNMLINLFSIQFPHPYSKTPREFVVYAGRLILKLLTEERINKRLYIDEFIWFLPFIRTIDSNIYEELIDSILEYRELSYEEKKNKFESVDNYVDLFANCMHECKYYFMRIFAGFGVFEFVEEIEHNNGNIFSFKHGNTSTYRRDKIGRYSGYIKLNNQLEEKANKLLAKYSPFDKPAQLSDPDICSKEEWITTLYEIEPIKYLAEIKPEYSRQSEISKILNNMTRAAIFGSVDGKEFEKSLKPVFELFDHVINVDIISGPGNTDLLCTAENERKIIFKLNVDGKSRNSSNNINVKRLNRHLKKVNAEYCVIVAPKFPRGTIEDIEGEPVVALKSEALARYCSKECMNNPTGQADFNSLNKIINNNLGKDISPLLNKITEQRYGISLT